MVGQPFGQWFYSKQEWPRRHFHGRQMDSMGTDSVGMNSVGADSVGAEIGNWRGRAGSAFAGLDPGWPTTACRA